MNWPRIGLLVLSSSGLALMVHGTTRYMSRIEQDRREDAAYQAFVDVVSRRTPGKVTETGLMFLDLADDPRDERVPQVVCYVRQAFVAELLAAREGAADDAARDLRRLNGALGRLSTTQAHGLLADTFGGQAPDPPAVRARLDPDVCNETRAADLIGQHSRPMRVDRR